MSIWIGSLPNRVNKCKIIKWLLYIRIIRLQWDQSNYGVTDLKQNLKVGLLCCLRALFYVNMYWNILLAGWTLFGASGKTYLWKLRRTDPGAPSKLELSERTSRGDGGGYSMLQFLSRVSLRCGFHECAFWFWLLCFSSPGFKWDSRREKNVQELKLPF